MREKWKNILAISMAIMLLMGQVVNATAYHADRSTFTDGRRPTDTFNTSSELVIKYAPNIAYQREGIIGFSLPDEDYADINKATLRLYLTKADGIKDPYKIENAQIKAFDFDADWDEGTVTFESQPDFSGEQEAGSGNLPSDVNQWVEIDITNYFKSKISDTKKLSFHLKGDEQVQAYMKVASAKSPNPPELVLEKNSTVPTPPSTVSETLDTSKTTYIYGGNEEGNFSSSNQMIIKFANNPKYRRDGLIGFKVPTGDYDDVAKATLKVFVINASVKPPVDLNDAAIKFYGFSGDWDETQVTWKDQPTYQDEEEIGNSPTAKDQWTEIDITDYFKANASSGNLSFRLEGDKKTEVYLNVAGKAHGNKPKIELEKATVTPPQNQDTQVDVDVNNVNRMVMMEDNDQMLKSLYINQKDGDKNRDKTDTLLIGKEYSAYLYTDTVKQEQADSAFLRFFVQKDYKQAPIPIEIWGIENPELVGENTSYNNQPATESKMIYELNVTNQGWYTVDVTSYVSNHSNYAFYLKAKDDDTPIVKISSYNSENTPVLYTAKGEDEFDLLRQKFAIKKSDYNANDPQIKAMIKRNDDKVAGYLAKLNKENDPSCVFWNYPLSVNQDGEAVKPATATNNMRNSYVWLSTMLRAYHTKGSKYEDDTDFYNIIKDGMKLLYEKSYNPSARENGNWWQWEIGVPKVLGEMIVTMYDDLEPEVRMNYLNAIFRFQPNPEMSYYNRNSENPKEQLPPQVSVGANRVDTCIGDLLLGIAAKNPQLIDHSVEALNPVYQFVKKGDGFYEDGSFVQHGKIAYTTAYGMVLVSGLTGLEHKLSKSRWEITSPDYQNVYTWIEKSFIPMVFDGQAFPIVAGRSLSRQYKKEEVGGSWADGYKVARMLYSAAQNAPADKKQAWLSLAKRFMEKNDFYNVKDNATNVSMLAEYEALQSVDMAEPYIASHVFANMDRIVHHRNDYAVGLAMYSSRIQNFEMMNGENLKGWNQGNGTLYLLNADTGQYDNAFWPTVDAYRLAGTTVDKVARLTEDHKEEFTMKSDFVGGVSLGNQYSVGAMVLNQPNYTNTTNYHTTLKAKKSWFFFDDEIIALGSGIESKDNRDIETIVENRMIRDDGSNQVLINGNDVLKDVSLLKQDFDNVSWAYLEGSKDASASIGYFFPEPVTLSGVKQNQMGSWSQVNKKGDQKPISRKYLQLWLEHGKNPVDQQYSYALLPSMTASEVKEYAKNPHYQVLKNTGQVQAVYEKKLGILAANVFDKAAGDLGEIQVDQPCSVMFKNKDGKISLSVADPTMKLNQPLTLELTLDKEVTINEQSNNIKVISNNPLKIEISLTGAQGSAATLDGSYKVSEEQSPLTPYIPQSTNENHSNDVTPESSVKDQLLTDISNSWARKEIQELANIGIVKGYPNHQFMPNNLVTRAEAAQIIANVLNYLKIENKSIIDQKEKHPWYYPAVEQVKAEGLMIGDGYGEYYLNHNITRQDMFTILGRLGKWNLSNEEIDVILAPFTDSNQISDYAKAYIGQMIKMELVKGNDGKLKPKSDITRAELAVIIYRALKIINK